MTRSYVDKLAITHIYRREIDEGAELTCLN